MYYRSMQSLAELENWFDPKASTVYFSGTEALLRSVSAVKRNTPDLAALNLSAMTF